MKMLLATADNGKLEDLKIASQITEKMNRRLLAIINIREEEEKAKKENNEETLFDILDSFTEQIYIYIKKTEQKKKPCRDQALNKTLGNNKMILSSPQH